MARDQRRLAAIVSADVAGYSRLMGRDESGTLAALKAHRGELIDPKIAEHRGRIVKTTGDGLLLEFPSVVDAVRCAVDVQRGMAERNAGVPPEQRIEFRIGINVGDIIIDDEDIFGDGVNVAARLQTLAEPGGICVSRVVRDQVLDKLSFAFEDLGSQQVKNIARPVEAYRVDLESAPLAPRPGHGHWQRLTRSPWRRAAVGVVALGVAGIAVWMLPQFWKTGVVPKSTPAVIAADAGPLSIVVLPFTNLTGDANQAYVADGITASVTADLSRIRDAFIVDAKTAFAYKDKPVTAQQVGNDLGVHFVLQGSVQRNGTKIRINAQLADATTSAQLWTDTFEGDESDLFALQDQVTTRIANSIGREMVIVAARESERRKNAPRVADLMLRATALRATQPFTLEKFQQREALMREAIALDPQNARATAWLAAVLTAEGRQESEAATAERKSVEGREWALKAQKLDPNEPWIYMALGNYAVQHGDLEGAKRAYETRLALEPKDPDSYNDLAGYYRRAGNPRKAIELLTQAINMDPRHPSTDILLKMGLSYLQLGDYDATIDWLSKYQSANPSGLFSNVYIAIAYALKGDDAKARAVATELKRLAPHYDVYAELQPDASTGPWYAEYFEKTLLPAARKAGLVE